MHRRKKNKWLVPSYVNKIPYLPMYEMDFQSFKKKHSQLLNHAVKQSATRNVQGFQPRDLLNGCSEDEQLEFFRNISTSSNKPAILSLVAPFNNIYIP